MAPTRLTGYKCTIRNLEDTFYYWSFSSMQTYSFNLRSLGGSLTPNHSTAGAMLCPLSFRAGACREAAGRVITANTQCPKGSNVPWKYNSGHVQPGLHFHIFFQFWPKTYLVIINLLTSFLPAFLAPHSKTHPQRLPRPAWSVMMDNANMFKSSQTKIWIFFTFCRTK